MRVFTELTPECDKTAQMFAAGLEKKEIASIKCRAISTIANQLQTAFEILCVRNGRELAIKLAERLTGINLDQMTRSIVAISLLLILFVDFQLEARRSKLKTSRSTKIETIAKVTTKAKGRDIPLII